MKKLRKKTLICYGNKHGYKVVFSPSYFLTWGEQIIVPLLLKKPLANCIIKYRITIEEIN